MSTNPNISFEYIQQHLNGNTNYEEWERNPNVPLEYIKSKDFEKFNHWRGNLILGNPNLTLDYIRDNVSVGTPVYNSHWKYISCNPSLTIDWLLEFPDADWDWKSVSANSNITPEHILNNPQLKWDWTAVTRNPSVTMEFIENNPELSWDRYYIGMNPNIDIIYLKKQMKKSHGLAGNIFGILSSPSIAIKDYISYIEPLMKDPECCYLRFYSCRAGICTNPNMTLDHIKEWVNSEKNNILDWQRLSSNPELKA